MNDTPQDDTAAAIAADIASAAPYRPHRPAAGLPDVAAAYPVQDRVVARLIAQGDRRPVAGYKIAVNAPALMRRFGVSEPASGRVFGDQTHASPARLPASGFRDFAYEPEIAAIMATGLPAAGAPFTGEQVARAIARFVPALELIDLRGAEMTAVHLPDVVAQNITNAGAVLGGEGVTPDRMDHASVVTEAAVDGVAEPAIHGGAPQPPLEAVTWLANHLAARGVSLEAGQFVLCGTHAPIRRIGGAASLKVTMSGLGEVALDLAPGDGGD